MIFRKAWETSSSGLSSFLGRSEIWHFYMCTMYIVQCTMYNVFFEGQFSERKKLHIFTGFTTFSLQIHWVTGQEEEVRSSCKAVQVWKILKVFGQYWMHLAFQAVQVWKILSVWPMLFFGRSPIGCISHCRPFKFVRSNFFGNIHIWEISYFRPFEVLRIFNSGQS